jgi:HSP20 family protein
MKKYYELPNLLYKLQAVWRKSMNELELKSDRSGANWLASQHSDSGAGHFHIRTGARSRVWSPPTDVYETDDAVIVRVEVSGMKNAEFAISLDEQILTIQGVRPDQPEQRAYHQMEIHFGEFRSQIGLHWVIDQENIEAEYNDGFLRLVLPKAKPQQIEIGE